MAQSSASSPLANVSSSAAAHSAVIASNEPGVDAENHPACGFMPCLTLLPLPDEVKYRVNEPMSVVQAAHRWGVALKSLLQLNPELTPQTQLKTGQILVADAYAPSAPVPYSRGKCNHGKIHHARLMPEGNGYFLRDYRPNSWGVDTTIQSLITVFDLYAQTYPDAHKINVGDLSRRRGGRIKPHKSHQSGRDVDFGFVHTVQKDNGRFTRATASNLDVEKTWFLVESLARTGNVQVIYIDKFVQKQLYRYAADKLTQEQREFFFSTPRHKNASHALLQHWPGHRNHFHVRFKCPQGQFGCRK